MINYTQFLCFGHEGFIFYVDSLQTDTPPRISSLKYLCNHTKYELSAESQSIQNINLFCQKKTKNPKTAELKTLENMSPPRLVVF